MNERVVRNHVAPNIGGFLRKPGKVSWASQAGWEQEAAGLAC